MILLGINAYHPDASVALVKDGVPVWAGEEERFNRIKHASGFPRLALRHALEEAGIPPSAIDVVAISKNPRANLLRKILYVLRHKPDWNFVFNRLKAFRTSSHYEQDFAGSLYVPPTFLKAKFVHVEHHQAHAASSFFVSGFDVAALLSLDALGDFSSAMWGLGKNNDLCVFGRIFFPHSIGFLYTAATQFLGFHSFGDEYKVMGLAAYGTPTYLEQFRHMIFLKNDGTFELNLNYFLHHKGHSKIRWEGGYPEQDLMYSPRWMEKFGPPRPPGEAITERDQNIAASLQACLEEVYFHILNHLYKKTKVENLCLAGGVAFNSVANGKIIANTPFKRVYIQPAAGDAGTALGAALFVNHSVLNKPRTFVMDHAFLGSEFDDLWIKRVLEAKGLWKDSVSLTGGSCAEYLREEELLQKTAERLAEGAVVGWFQGRMEFGPRALGNRSILADPRRRDMKDILNARIKRRESFRPFAPAVPVEDARTYFEMDCNESPFMIKVFGVKEEKREQLPAITHVDGTARVQTVDMKSNPLFWKLLKAFGKKTGIPVLLNTSFNENEPIVCTPQEALDCFLKTKMDVLVMGRFYLEKKDLPFPDPCQEEGEL